ncbi:MAG TPA: 16S rRNA (guanine(966)-N(2))-methyltransferase RsmD [Planctomycetota bacterium]|nr:16S rRNA (guanine(966)-N(2))-methyltransferase RsmD [Planctomycetota bacterium]
MRIISGARKGKLLHTLEGLETRPMPDMAKGAIFNIIRTRVPGARVLDLFSGTGTLGVEALSNGAAKVTFVEANPAAVTLLKRNLHKIQAEPKSDVVEGFAGRAVKQLKNRREQFNLIFADPPFVFMKQFAVPMKEDIYSMADVIGAARELLFPGGLLVLRYESGDALAPIAGFVPLSERNPARRYGRSTVAFLVRSDEAGAQFEFPSEADFRGHRPKNMERNVALRAGESARPEDEDEEDGSAEAADVETGGGDDGDGLDEA